MEQGTATPDAEARTARQLEEMRALIARHARPDFTTAIDGFTASCHDHDDAHSGTTGAVFALIAQGTKTLTLGDHECRYGAGQYLVTSVDLPVTGQFVGASPDEPALGFGLHLRTSTIASLLLESDPSAALRPRTPAPAPLGLGVAQAEPELLDAALRVLALLDRATDHAVLGPMLEREIVWRLLNGPLGEAVRQLGLADSLTTHVNRAVRWISTHYAEGFRVADLARLCGMSPSAFHRSFRTVTGLTPIQFQKQIRLQEARALLLAGHDVAQASTDVGYDSASQFSREYRRQFGLPPGRDATRLRALGPTPDR